MTGGVDVGAHVVIAVDLGHADLAKQAGLHDPVAGFHEVRRAAPLRADLHGAVVLAGRVEHGFPLHHVDADRLLHVDIRAGLDRRDHRQGMPVVGRGDSTMSRSFSFSMAL